MRATNVRTVRLRRKMSQRQLSDASGVEQPIISRIENGRVSNPAFDTVIKLAKALDVDPRMLRFGPDSVDHERVAS